MSELVYCTYFDSAFLARGIAMLRSLWRHDPAATVVALALDELCGRVLRDTFGDALHLIGIPSLQDFAPALRDLRARRSAWAYYATQKPSLVEFAMESAPTPAAVFYLDADLWFAGSLAPLFAEIAGASVGLLPHRFSHSQRHLAVYGIYNAGCVYFRNDAAGRRCLAGWRDDCLAWCAEEPQPDGRFMNQGYLTGWPERYPRVHIVRHPGADVGPWNLEDLHLDVCDSRLTVDGAPLLFYHFSGLSRTPGGQWRSHYPHAPGQIEILRRFVYGPYLREVEAESLRLNTQYGTNGIASVRSMEAWPGLVPFQSV